MQWDEKAVERYIRCHLRLMFTRHFAHWPPGQPKTLELPQASVYANLEASAAQHPQRAAIDYYGSRLSYAELKRQVDALAGFLQQRCGVQRGDRVLLYVQNSPQFVIAYYAILRADAVVVPVNPMNRTEELRHYVEDSDAAVAIAGQECCARSSRSRLEHVLRSPYSDYLTGPTDLPLPDFVRAPRGARASVEEALAREPRARRRTWRSPRISRSCPIPRAPPASRRAACTRTPACRRPPCRTSTGAARRSESVVLCALPMFHVTGMQAGMNAPIHIGATLVVLSRWDRDCAALQIERARVTNWSAITTMLVDFLSNPNLEEVRPFARCASLGGGGAAMPEALARRLEEVIGLPFVEGYGLSETMAPTHINPPHRPKRQCGGIPFFNTDARVIDRGKLVELPPDEVGEIIVHGPQVFQRLLEAARGDRAGVPPARRQALLPHRRPRLLRRGRLLLHHRPAEAHDQLLGLQGLAGRGRGDALRASRRSRRPASSARATATAARR